MVWRGAFRSDADSITDAPPSQLARRSQSGVDLAAALVREREAAEVARLARLGRLADLLAGRITPQDLISLQRFVWKDNAYVGAP